MHIRDSNITASRKAADTMQSTDRWGPRFCKHWTSVSEYEMLYEAIPGCQVIGLVNKIGK